MLVPSFVIGHGQQKLIMEKVLTQASSLDEGSHQVVVHQPSIGGVANALRVHRQTPAMNSRDGKRLLRKLLNRSICSVKVAAILRCEDKVVAVGWNHIGFDGLGMHAEADCLRRVNLRRLQASTLYVAAERKRNGRAVKARPCPDCERLIRGLAVGRVLWRDSDGEWRDL